MVLALYRYRQLPLLTMFWLASHGVGLCKGSVGGSIAPEESVGVFLTYVHADGVVLGIGAVEREHSECALGGEVDGVGAGVILQRVAVQLLYGDGTRVLARHIAQHVFYVGAVGQGVRIVNLVVHLVDVELVGVACHVLGVGAVAAILCLGGDILLECAKGKRGDDGIARIHGSLFAVSQAGGEEENNG